MPNTDNRTQDAREDALHTPAGTAPDVVEGVEVAVEASPPSLLLCAYRSLSVETALCVTELARRGWRMRFHAGDAMISRIRSWAVSRWFVETEDDVFLMIDDDIAFSPEGAERVVAVARETRSIACGEYPVRGGAVLTSAMLPETPPFTFAPGAAPVEVGAAATGFMAVHREVIAALIQKLPRCSGPGRGEFWPLFLPFVGEDIREGKTGSVYYGEDTSFCIRARAAGVRIWLAPDVRLAHIKAAQHVTPEGLRWDGTDVVAPSLPAEETA